MVSTKHQRTTSSAPSTYFHVDLASRAPCPIPTTYIGERYGTSLPTVGTLGTVWRKDRGTVKHYEFHTIFGRIYHKKSYHIDDWICIHQDILTLKKCLRL